ncbi:DUF4352 domain-containing protein [Paenibacillus glacialis]|uniref:DUF4352 domain-containing protein n=1 Tax=Paenibacillus glacialis TaxID=494026 RepID=A0A162MF14_9BACL|nr:DUF4352 domain-containing protein [Paenibacillus glacialis]OAB43373.1 hypothetical protein PGLA_09000 [Paenibacillus glacialis]
MKFKFVILVASAMLMLSACSTEAAIEKVEPASTKESTAPVKEDKKEEVKKEETKPTTEVFKPGDAVTFNDLIITLNSAKDHKGNDFQKPADGKVFKVVDVTIENKGTKEAPISSIINTSMVDSDGYKYTIALATFVENQLDGSVPAGRKLRGQVAFEIPKDAPGLEFIFSDPFTKGQAIWNLQ